jgi:hypothetical protein
MGAWGWWRTLLRAQLRSRHLLLLCATIGVVGSLLLLLLYGRQLKMRHARRGERRTIDQIFNMVAVLCVKTQRS